METPSRKAASIWSVRRHRTDSSTGGGPVVQRPPLAITFGRDRLQERGKTGWGAIVRAGSAAAARSSLRNQLPAQPVEQAHRHHRPALDRGLDSGELIDRPPQTAKLRLEQIQVRGPRLGHAQHLGRLDRRPPARGRRSRDSQRLARHGDDFQIEHHLASRRPFERSAQAAGQLGVVGLPDLLTDLEPSQVDRLATKTQLDPAGDLGGRCRCRPTRSVSDPGK